MGDGTGEYAAARGSVFIKGGERRSTELLRQAKLPPPGPGARAVHNPLATAFGPRATRRSGCHGVAPP